MTKPSKFKATRSLYIVLFVVVISVISSVFFFSNLKNQESTTNSNIGIKECSASKTSNPSDLNFEEMYIFENKHNGFKVSLPKSFTLAKGPLGHLSDQEYLQLNIDSSEFQYGFGKQNSDNKGSDISVLFRLNLDKCTTTQQCFNNSIPKLDQQMHPCYIKTQINDKAIRLIRSLDSKNFSATNWETYIETKHGVLSVYFSQKGKSDNIFPEVFNQILKSIELTN